MVHSRNRYNHNHQKKNSGEKNYSKLSLKKKNGKKKNYSNSNSNSAGLEGKLKFLNKSNKLEEMGLNSPNKSSFLEHGRDRSSCNSSSSSPNYDRFRKSIAFNIENRDGLGI